MSLLSCDKVSCGGVLLLVVVVVVGVYCEGAGEILQHPHSLLGTTDTAHCEADPGLQLY